MPKLILAWLLIFCVMGYAPAAEASFEKEYKNKNRQKQRDKILGLKQQIEFQILNFDVYQSAGAGPEEGAGQAKGAEQADLDDEIREAAALGADPVWLEGLSEEQRQAYAEKIEVLEGMALEGRAGKGLEEHPAPEPPPDAPDRLSAEAEALYGQDIRKLEDLIRQMEQIREAETGGKQEGRAPDSVKGGLPEKKTEFNERDEEMIQKALELKASAVQKMRAISELKDRMQNDSPWRVPVSTHMILRRESNTYETRIDARPETHFRAGPTISAVKWKDGWRYESQLRLMQYWYKNFSHNNYTDRQVSQGIMKQFPKLLVSMGCSAGWKEVRTESRSEKPDFVRDKKFDFDLRYPLGSKTFLSAYYTRATSTFMGSLRKSSNQCSHTVGGSLDYALTPATKVFFDYSFAMSRPPKGMREDDLNDENFSLGVSGSLTGRVFYSLDIGLNRKENKESEEDGIANGYTLDGVLTYRMTPKLSLDFDIQRSQVAEFDTTLKDPTNLTFGCGANYRWTSKLKLDTEHTFTVEESYSNNTVTDPDYPESEITAIPHTERYKGSIGLSYDLTDHMSLELRHSWLRVSDRLKTGAVDSSDTVCRFTKRY